MQGVDPFRYMQMAAGKLDQLETRREAEKMLDDLEYLYEVLDPELMRDADRLIAILREKLSTLA
ncbi:MAG: hypothetical protein C0631_05550 [Sedimenticola sp.]|jgi:hypothetical protein|nr:MAG: hypothetical protein C0631_05550 [Sedimenticola sp.]